MRGRVVLIEEPEQKTIDYTTIQFTKPPKQNTEMWVYYNMGKKVSGEGQSKDCFKSTRMQSCHTTKYQVSPASYSPNAKQLLQQPRTIKLGNNLQGRMFDFIQKEATKSSPMAGASYSPKKRPNTTVPVKINQHDRQQPIQTNNMLQKNKSPGPNQYQVVNMKISDIKRPKSPIMLLKNDRSSYIQYDKFIIAGPGSYSPKKR